MTCKFCLFLDFLIFCKQDCMSLMTRYFFSPHSIMSSVSFSCLIVLTRTPSEILNKSGENENPCHVSGIVPSNQYSAINCEGVYRNFVDYFYSVLFLEC